MLEWRGSTTAFGACARKEACGKYVRERRRVISQNGHKIYEDKTCTTVNHKYIIYGSRPAWSDHCTPRLSPDVSSGNVVRDIQYPEDEDFCCLANG